MMDEERWVMHGLNADDPNCIKSVEQLQKYIEEIGFLPLFRNEIPGFSVEEHTAADSWWSEDPESDPWEWRKIIAGNGRIAYGKFFDKKAGFISGGWLPAFANYRRDGYDFDARWDDELASIRSKKIMDLFAEENADRELYSFEEKVRLYRSGEYPETWDEGGSCFGKGEDTAAYDDEELPFTRRGFDPEQAVPYVGIQYSSTGVFGYSFRDEFDNEMVTVNSLVLPRPDIQITASGRKLWHRQFDGGITLAPGIRRNIEDENGKTAAYFEYMDIDAFRICIKKNQTLFVSVGPERWIISDGDDGVVALISRLAEDEREHFTENGLDMEERFLVEVMSDIDEELLPFICAVPVLGL